MYECGLITRCSSELAIEIYTPEPPAGLRVSFIPLPDSVFGVRGNLFAYEQPVKGTTLVSRVMTVQDLEDRKSRRFQG
jgi:hypothetical protein